MMKCIIDKAREKFRLSAMLLPILFMVSVTAWGQNRSPKSEHFAPIKWYASNASSSLYDKSSSTIYEKKISLSFYGVALEEVLKAIAQKADLRLSYDKKQLANHTVTFVRKNLTVIEAFEDVLKGTGLEVLASPNGQVVIKQSKKPKVVEVQAETVIGTVTDASTGETLPGVNIRVKGTTTGTSTDNKGHYEVEVPSLQDTLVFSFVGYQTQTIAINGRAKINIKLKTQAIFGKEVVVTGYGTEEKRNLTSSISTVSPEEIQGKEVASVTQALQGKVAGLQVTTNSSSPGGGVKLRIRGANSINSSSDPLFIVDGMPATGISNLSPQIIESVNVLKDASATALYGSKGANGVIVITTKEGRINETEVSYNGRISVETFSEDLGLMNAKEFASFYTKYQKTGNPNIEQSQLFYNGSSYARPLPSAVGKGTDWFDVVTRSGFVQDHQLTVSGGSDVSTYLVSLNYRQHKGLIKGGDYKRYSLQFNNSSQLTEWLESKVHLFLSNHKTNGSGDNTGLEGQSGVIAPTIKMLPTLPIQNSKGGYQENNFPSSQTRENPLAATTETDLHEQFKVRGNVSLIFHPISHVSLNVLGGLRIRRGDAYNYNPSTTIYGALSNGYASQNVYRYEYYISKNVAKYNNTFGGVHQLNVTAAFTYQQQTNSNLGVSASDFFTDKFLYNNLGAANTPNAPNSGKSKYQLASGLGRINYIYNDKYLLTLTSRYDGSSKFGKGNKWGLFPSVAAAWRISNEDFMRNVSAISSLKLRASYGETGNSRIGLYQSLGILGQQNYDFGTQIVPGVAVGSLANDELGWETTTTTNVGIDAGFLNDRINLTADAYLKKTRDLLLTVNLIQTSGFTQALRNVGKLQNKGLELSVNADVIRSDNFQWNVGGNIYLNRNKITKLTGDPSQRWKIGEPGGAQRFFHLEGIINDQQELNNYTVQTAEVGDWKYKDVNKDGTLDGDDLLVDFNPNPAYSFGISTDFNYKSFNLSLFFDGVQGNQIINANDKYLTDISQPRNNLSEKVLSNYWTPNRKYNVDYARLHYAQYNSDDTRERYIEDGSYIRLENVKFAYNFSHFSRSLKNATVYVSGQNLLLLTDYSGFDPDVDNGRDGAAYPRPRIYSLGINFKF